MKVTFLAATVLLSVACSQTPPPAPTSPEPSSETTSKACEKGTFSWEGACVKDCNDPANACKPNERCEQVRDPNTADSPVLGGLCAPDEAASPAASADQPPAPKQSPEEQKFWADLALAYNSKLEECKTGWTGDGNLTVKDGKIATFELMHSPDKGTPQPKLKGTKVPPIPASLQKAFEGTVGVSVCTGTARTPSP